MTAQISDRVDYEGRTFELAGISGSGLFEPADHGLEVRALHTACWRGYHCRYLVEDRALVLGGVELGLEDPPEELFGAPRGKAPFGGGAVYTPVRVPVPFSGGLLLGSGFLRELYVHMGFHPAWKYESVWELLFAEGRLDAAHDRSEAMARRRAAQGRLEPARDDPALVGEWIESTFDRTY